MDDLRSRFDQIDLMVTAWMARYGVVLLRLSIGLVYVWFGGLKLVPGASPAEALIRQTLTFLPIPMGFFIPFLGVWEMGIGLGFMTGRFMRLTILLMAFQMIGAVSPILLYPAAVFSRFPFVLTLEGQYIVKNSVLIAAALVIGATVRGGGLADRPALIDKAEPAD